MDGNDIQISLNTARTRAETVDTGSFISRGTWATLALLLQPTRVRWNVDVCPTLSCKINHATLHTIYLTAKRKNTMVVSFKRKILQKVFFKSIF